jgi:hypothetical protein
MYHAIIQQDNMVATSQRSASLQGRETTALRIRQMLRVRAKSLNTQNNVDCKQTSVRKRAQLNRTKHSALSR